MDNKTPIGPTGPRADNRNTPDQTLSAIYRVLVLIALMLGANVLYFGRDLIMPLVLGILLAMTLSPVVRATSNYRVPAPIVSVFMIAIAGLIVTLGTYSLSDSLSELIESVPTVKEKIESRLLEYKEPIDSV